MTRSRQAPGALPPAARPQRRLSRSRLLLAASALALLLPATVASADAPTQIAQADAVVAFDIPGQPLARALERYSETTGVAFAFSGDLDNLTSVAVSGDLTPRDALRRLIGGAPVLFRFTDERNVTLERVAVQPNSATQLLSPIVVTGERRTTGLQGTASSVAVLTEDDVARRSPNTVYEAVRGVANTIPAQRRGLPAIRGETGDPNGGLEVGTTTLNTLPRTALIIDDSARLATAANASSQSVFDIEQVEVLRGPQTSGRGSSAIGGAYVVKTKDPIFDTEANFLFNPTVTDADGNSQRVAAMLNAPLIEDQVAARMTAEYERGDYPFEIRSDVQALTAENADRNDINNYYSLNIRNKFLIEPEAAPEISALLTTEYAESSTASFSDLYVNTSEGIDDRIISPAGNAFDSRSLFVSSKIDYDVSDLLELRSLTSWQREKIDSSDNNQTTTDYNFNTQKALSQEFIADIADNEYVSGVIGVAYQSSSLVGNYDSARAGGNVDVDSRNRSYSVFFDGAINILDNFRILAGGRYQNYKSNFKFDINQVRLIDEDFRDSVFLPKAGVQLDVTDEQTVSLTYRRGFNPGGASISQTLTTQGPTIFESEFVDTYEATYRGSFFDDRLTTSFTAFYNEWENRQLFAIIRDPSNALNFEVTVENFDEAESYGAEFEVTGKPIDQVQLSAGIGLLQTQITNAGSDVENLEANGNNFGDDPWLTMSASAVWSPFEGAELYGSAQFVAGYDGDFNNNASEQAGNYELYNIGGSYTYDRYSVRLDIRNLLNEDAVLAQSSTTVNLSEPRTFSLNGSVKF